MTCRHWTAPRSRPPACPPGAGRTSRQHPSGTRPDRQKACGPPLPPPGREPLQLGRAKALVHLDRVSDRDAPRSGDFGINAKVLMSEMGVQRLQRVDIPLARVWIGGSGKASQDRFPDGNFGSAQPEHSADPFEFLPWRETIDMNITAPADR